jgi:pimeloyl-ACP methyl ester carboxylesterase
LVATDYEGLGTPGVPTSTVGLAEGHAVLDSVRAVAALPNAGSLGDVLLAGHSQGGRAALFAGEIASTYAPDLRLVGVAALAPGVELPALVDHLASSPAKATVLMGAIGLRAAYPDLDLATVFTPDAIADIPRVETECVDTTVARYEPTPTSELISRAPSSVTEVERILEENSPGAIAPTVPIFIGHSEADEQVPVELSARLMAKYCALGATVIRRTYPGQDHVGVIDAADGDVLAFVANRYDHRQATNTCG